MTRDECGLTLCETIATLSGIATIDQQRAIVIYRDDHERHEELLTRRKMLQQILAKQLPLLNDQEMADILARYPWVTRC